MSKKKKIRRKRRTPKKNWPYEIKAGHTNDFYKSTDWDIARERALFRDNHLCQYYLGNYREGPHHAKNLKIIEATTVHHIVPIKEAPHLCLDINNLISLSHEAHEIIEGRDAFSFRKTKPLAEERW